MKTTDINPLKNCWSALNRNGPIRMKGKGFNFCPTMDYEGTLSHQGYKCEVYEIYFHFCCYDEFEQVGGT
jgi:hypothetical protein